MTQKQELLGGLIAGKVIDKALDVALNKMAARSTNDVKKADVPEIKEVVTEAVEAEIKPRLDHLTNNEPFYKSRVFLGSVAGILAGVSSLVQMLADGNFDGAVFTSALTGVLGGMFALWGRYGAQKPLGE